MTAAIGATLGVNVEFDLCGPKGCDGIVSLACTALFPGKGVMFCLSGGIEAKFFEDLFSILFACKFARIWLVVVITFLCVGGDDLIGWTRTGTGFVSDNVVTVEDGDNDDGIDDISFDSTVLIFDIDVHRFCSTCGCEGSEIDIFQSIL